MAGFYERTGARKKERAVPSILQLEALAPLVAQFAQAPAAAQPNNSAARNMGTGSVSDDVAKAAGQLGFERRKYDDTRGDATAAKQQAIGQGAAAEEAVRRAVEAGELPEAELVRIGLLPPEQKAQHAAALLDPTHGISAADQAEIDATMYGLETDRNRVRGAYDLGRQELDQGAEAEAARLGLDTSRLGFDQEKAARDAALAQAQQQQASLEQDRRFGLDKAAANRGPGPVTVGKGEQLVDPATGKILASNVPPPGSEVDEVTLAGQKEAAKLNARNTAGRQMAMPEEMAGVQSGLETAQRLLELNPTAAAGFSGGLYSAFDKGLGVFGLEGLTETDAADTEEMNSLFSSAVGQAAQSLKGALSDKDIEFLRQQAGDSSMSMEGRQRIIQTMQRGYTRKQAMLQAEQEALAGGATAAEAQQAAIAAIGGMPADELATEAGAENPGAAETAGEADLAGLSTEDLQRMLAEAG
jgi:hypothetical protein